MSLAHHLVDHSKDVNLKADDVSCWPMLAGGHLLPFLRWMFGQFAWYEPWLVADGFLQCSQDLSSFKKLINQ